MKFQLFLTLITLFPSLLFSQDKTVDEKWFNGSLKKHLVQRGQDTLYFEYGYENGQTALKRWGKDSLYFYSYEGAIVEKYFGSIGLEYGRYTADSIIQYDAEGRRELIRVKRGFDTFKSYFYDADEVVYTKTYSAEGNYENRKPDNTLWTRGSFVISTYDKKDTLFSQNGKIQAIIQENELFQQRDKRYRLFDEKGHILYESEGETVLKLEKDNSECLYGFQNQKGDWVIPPQYENVKSLGLQYYIASTFNSAVILNQKGEKIEGTECEFLETLNPHAFCWSMYGLSGQTNEYLIMPNFSYETALLNLDFENTNLLKFRKNGKYGVIDARGNVLLPPQYQDVRKHEAGFFEVRIGKKWGLVDASGRIIVQPIYTDVAFSKKPKVFITSDTINLKALKNGFRPAKNGLVNDQSQVIVPLGNFYITALNNGNFYFQNDNNRYHLFNADKGFLVDTTYNIDWLVRDKYFRVSNPKNGLGGIVDMDGNIVAPLEYLDIKHIDVSRRPLFNIFGLKTKDGKWGIYNTDAKNWAYSPVLDDVSYVFCYLGNSSSGSEPLGNTFQYYRPSHFAIKKNGKWQILNKDFNPSPLLNGGFDYYGFTDEDNSFNERPSWFLVKDKKLQFYTAASFPLLTSFNKNTGFKKKQKIFKSKTLDGIELLYNESGDLLAPPQYKLKNLANHYAIVEDSVTKAQKLLSFDGTMKDLLPQYNVRKVNIEKNIALVEDPKTKLIGVVNMEAKVLIPVKNFAGVFSEHENVLWIRPDFPNIPKDSFIYYHEYHLNALDSNWHLYNLVGQQLSGTAFQKPFHFYNSIGIGLVSDKMGLWNDKGEVVIPPQYKYILRDTIDNIYYLAREWADSSLTFGFADSTGRIIKSADFRMMSPFFGDYALAIEKGQKGIIDKKGQWICPPEPNALINFKGALIDSLILKSYKPEDYKLYTSKINPHTHHIFRGLNGNNRAFGFELGSYFHPLGYYDSLTVENQTAITNICLDVLMPSYILPERVYFYDRVDDSLVISPLFLNTVFHGVPEMHRLKITQKEYDSKVRLYNNKFDAAIVLEDFKVNDRFINVITNSWRLDFRSHNFYFKNGYWKKLEINEVLNLSYSNILSLNNILMNKIKELKNEDLDCSNSASYFDVGSKVCYITPAGIEFQYQRRKGKYFEDRQNEWNSVNISLTWSELTHFIKMKP